MSGWRNEPIKSTGFDAQIKHEDGYELHFYTDRLEAYRAVEKVCQEQIDRKPKTRGDELRAMTDEELIRMLTVCFDCFYCPINCPDSVQSIGECHQAKLDWLKQDAVE